MLLISVLQVKWRASQRYPARCIKWLCCTVSEINTLWLTLQLLINTAWEMNSFPQLRCYNADNTLTL